MPEFPLNTSVNITLDVSGNGTAKIGPNVGQQWNPTNVSVHVSTATNFPKCSIYAGGSSQPGQLVDSTYTGNDDSSGKIEGTVIFPGHNIWAVWTGGDANATATLSVFGTYTTNYRRAHG